jgi:AAA+ ATPase superfamily predicted ATPase
MDVIGVYSNKGEAMSQVFVGRSAELARCRKMAASRQFECLVLYGRRRVGKTYLMLELLKDHKGLYFAFEQQSTPVLLEKFSERLLQQFPSAFLSSFSSFEQAFLYLAEQVGTEPFTLALDEFQYVAMQDKSFLSMLQNLIDHHWQKTNLFLILCGSYMSFMESEVLGVKSPVFGRRTASLKLEPLRFSEARILLGDYSNLDAFIAWGIVGGMPLYLKQFNTRMDIRQNILDNILAKGSLLNNEPVFALKQELREPSLYFSILEGISTGRTKYNEITGWIGADAGYYLNNLIALGIVSRKCLLEKKTTQEKDSIGSAIHTSPFTFAISAAICRWWRQKSMTFYGNRSFHPHSRIIWAIDLRLCAENSWMRGMVRMHFPLSFPGKDAGGEPIRQHGHRRRSTGWLRMEPTRSFLSNASGEPARSQSRICTS